jgi:hypothetical protein
MIVRLSRVSQPGRQPVEERSGAPYLSVGLDLGSGGYHLYRPLPKRDSASL